MKNKFSLKKILLIITATVFLAVTLTAIYLALKASYYIDQMDICRQQMAPFYEAQRQFYLERRQNEN